MPTDVDLPREGMIYQREQYQKGGMSRRYWDYKDNLLIKYARDSGEIIDVGCGEGILLEKLAGLFPKKRIVGIDAESENLEICRKYGLNVAPGSVYRLEFDNESVDCVIFSEVIEHLNEAEKAIGEIARVLKKNGILILLFPNDTTFKLFRIAALMIKEAFYDTGHAKQWRPKEMKRFLDDSGLKTVVSKSIPFYFWPVSLHHLIVAKKVYSYTENLK